MSFAKSLSWHCNVALLFDINHKYEYKSSPWASAHKRLLVKVQKQKQQILKVLSSYFVCAMQAD